MTVNQNTRIEKPNILREMWDWIKHFRRDHKEHLSLSLKSPSRQEFVAIFQFYLFDWRSSKCWSANETSNFDGRTSTIRVVIVLMRHNRATPPGDAHNSPAKRVPRNSHRKLFPSVSTQIPRFVTRSGLWPLEERLQRCQSGRSARPLYRGSCLYPPRKQQESKYSN